MKITRKTRKELTAEIEKVVKKIVSWRDGNECVEREIDGRRCGGGMNWGHFVPRKQSRHLKYDLATFIQCRNHNMLHDKGAQTFQAWFVGTFGVRAMQLLDRVAREMANTKLQPVYELEETLAKYNKLYENRYYVEHEIEELVRKGYYGEYIKAAWKEEGWI
jgi:hypothetical protein